MSSNTLRDLQLFELEMLKDVKAVCERYNIRFYLDAGTCLGAVRHKGFIPWDDDIDISMPIDDYVRFLSVAQEALGEQYFLQTAQTDDSFHMSYARVRRNNTTMMRDYEDDTAGHHGIWLDVFPLLPVGGNLDRKIKKAIVTFTNLLCMSDAQFQHNKSWIAQQNSPVWMFLIKGVRSIMKHTRKRFGFFLRKRLFRSKQKQYLADLWGTITTYAPTSAFREPPAYLQFEDTFFPCPSDYDCALRYWYGDYMKLPPIADRTGGHGHLYVDLQQTWTSTAQMPPSSLIDYSQAAHLNSEEENE